MNGTIRVSLGTASKLGFLDVALEARPRTAYLMLHHEGRCDADCGFCPQAKNSKARIDMLSRVTWPSFSLASVIQRLEKRRTSFERACVQTVSYPRFFDDLMNAVERLARVRLPMSVCSQPLSLERLTQLKEMGAQMVGIPLDAAKPSLFRRVKRETAPWERLIESLRDAERVFGRGNVWTHLMVGLGETEEEATRFIQRMHDMGVLVALFAFTPVPGTRLSHDSPPALGAYRRLQIARSLITSRRSRFENMSFDGGKIIDLGVSHDVVEQAALSGEPFMTSGCPGCNRPFYNERPSGPIYNFPFAPPRQELVQVLSQLGSVRG